MTEHIKDSVSEFREHALELGYSFFQSKVLLTATRLDVFNIIGETGISACDVATKLKSNVNATKMFLDAMVCLDLLKKDDRMYFNTENGREIFIKGSERYIGDIVNLQDVMWNAWSALGESVISGNPVRRPDMFQEVKDETRNFITAMHNTAMTVAPILSNEIDLSRSKTLIDIGGGAGTYSVFFCKANSNLDATILDLSGTLEITKELIFNSNVRNRIHLIEGDFNKEIKGQYDVAFLSNIIHGEGEIENMALMKRIYNALNSGGKIIIQDFILDNDKTSPPFPALFSLNMLLFTENGRTYSFEEIEGWLEKAGFRGIARMNINLPRSFSVLVGNK
ncbi:MAG: methyltransferase [Candidatus Scalindua sp.]|jgi:precorrin-6B methylase 2|nr:methyltransferase [Candidatus Scalindua sp.]MBT5305881.1 methyltransferase [Candidatus Scalindua sp.]MBT6047393.1 methyltransferase [Candidatus Scalindua sp.]MBT6228249.1 methyltransferase [Candidatus Scalindua sp.]MBT7211676.1 methyltransferase [Candidatus Scalindua sp.]